MASRIVNAVGVLVASVALVGSMFVLIETQPELPRCYEDQVLVGRPGTEFDNGRFDAYDCGPAMDDFEGYAR